MECRTTPEDSVSFEIAPSSGLHMSTTRAAQKSENTTRPFGGQESGTVLSMSQFILDIKWTGGWGLRCSKSSRHLKAVDAECTKS
jgi:hypothetical protein